MWVCAGHPQRDCTLQVSIPTEHKPNVPQPTGPHLSKGVLSVGSGKERDPTKAEYKMAPIDGLFMGYACCLNMTRSLVDLVC